MFGEEVVEDRRLLVPVGARLLRGEGHVEQGGLGPWPADELEPDGEAAPVVPDLDGDGRQAQEVAGYGVPDQRRCKLRCIGGYGRRQRRRHACVSNELVRRTDRQTRWCIHARCKIDVVVTSVYVVELAGVACVVLQRVGSHT